MIHGHDPFTPKFMCFFVIHGHDPWFHGHDPLQEMTDFWTMSTKMLGPHGLMFFIEQRAAVGIASISQLEN